MLPVQLSAFHLFILITINAGQFGCFFSSSLSFIYNMQNNLKKRNFLNLKVFVYLNLKDFVRKKRTGKTAGPHIISIYFQSVLLHNLHYIPPRRFGFLHPGLTHSILNCPGFHAMQLCHRLCVQKTRASHSYG